MFGLGFWEIVVIAIVGLLVLGPRRLPEVARQVGRMVREFRRATNEMRSNLDEVTQEVQLERLAEERDREAPAGASQQPSPYSPSPVDSQPAANAGTGDTDDDRS